MNRLIVSCPNNNIQEREYIINIFLKDFLGIFNYDIVYENDETQYILSFHNKKIFINDAFFNQYKEPLSYLSVRNFPKYEVAFIHYFNKTLPVIYGDSQMFEDSDGIHCGLDIFASSFFLLTRWEEELIGRKETGKCSEESLFLIRSNLYKRPIVNEYIVFLSEMLSHIGVDGNAKHIFKVSLTHDVDRCYLTSWKEMFENVKKMWDKGSKKKSIDILVDFTYYKLFDKKPFDTFNDFLNYSSHLHEAEEIFYFKVVEHGEKGYTYSISNTATQAILKNLNKNSKAVIGFHPSESTINNSLQLKTEYLRIVSATEFKILNVRNHGLHTNVAMNRSLESLGIRHISNYGFQKRNGFRCGICYPFRIFDVYDRKVLDIVETPFVLMDTVWLRNQPSKKTALKDAFSIIDTVKQYNGTLTLNWHTNVFRMRKMRKYQKNYIKIIEHCQK